MTSALWVDENDKLHPIDDTHAQWYSDRFDTDTPQPDWDDLDDEDEYTAAQDDWEEHVLEEAFNNNYVRVRDNGENVFLYADGNRLLKPAVLRLILKAMGITDDRRFVHDTAQASYDGPVSYYDKWHKLNTSALSKNVVERLNQLRDYR